MYRYYNKPGNHEYVWSYRNLNQEQVQIRFNLVVAIAIAQIVFLSGIDASETRVRHNNTVFSSLVTFLLFPTCLLPDKVFSCEPFILKCFSPARSLLFKLNSFSYVKFRTRTLFETEAKGNLKMAY